MDFVDGANLAELLDRDGGPGLPPRRTSTYVEQACEALDYVHRSTSSHRDVKPQNLILASAASIVVDFGVARDWTAVRDRRRRHTGPDGARGLRGPCGLRPLRRLQPRGRRRDAAHGRPPGYTRRGSPLRGGRRRGRAGAAARPRVHAEAADVLCGGARRRSGAPNRARRGFDLALSVPGRPASRRSLVEAVVRTAAGVFDAAAASIALLDDATGGPSSTPRGVPALARSSACGSLAARGSPAPVRSPREPIVVPTVARLPVRVAGRRRHGLRARRRLLVVPLRRGSESLRRPVRCSTAATAALRRGRSPRRISSPTSRSAPSSVIVDSIPCGLSLTR